MKRTAIYLRVSTDRQAQEGDSIPAQRDALLKYIDAREDLILAGEYLDDGISGTRYDRDELQRLLADINAGKIDLVLVTKLDRLHRSIRNFLNFQEVLDKNKVDWLAIWEPIYDSSTPQGRMIINTMMSIAQFEAENTGQRVKQVLAYKASRGEFLGGPTPFGYSVVDKHLVPNEDAPKVVEIFERYDLNGGLQDTVNLADKVGYGRYKKTVRNLLTNRLYIGERGENKNYCEPIVSRELFESVQRKLKINVKADAKSIYIFRGLIRCSECGGLYGGNTQRGYKQYRCHKRLNTGGKGCANKKTILESKVERYLLENIVPLAEQYIATYEVEAEKRRDCMAEIRKQERRLDRLKALYLDEVIGLDEYKESREEILEKLKELKADPEAQAPDPKKVDAIRQVGGPEFRQQYEALDEEGKRAFWRKLIDRIEINPSGQLTVYFL